MRVFGVADGDRAGEVAGDLDAVAAAVAAVAGLVPHGADFDAVTATVAAVAGLAPAEHYLMRRIAAWQRSS